jgi:hypothetical protein
MVISRPIGLAMAAQVDRVNDRRTPQEHLRDAQQEIRDLQNKLAISNALLKEWQDRAQLAESAPTVIRGIVGAHGSLTTPARFAALHHTSVSTVNRALNAGEVTGIRQPNDRWLVYTDQIWTPKRKRGNHAD